MPGLSLESPQPGHNILVLPALITAQPDKPPLSPVPGSHQSSEKLNIVTTISILLFRNIGHIPQNTIECLQEMIQLLPIMICGCTNQFVINIAIHQNESIAC